MQGVLLYPTSENISKWSIKIDKPNDNMVIQVVYDKNKEAVVKYREVSFEGLSEKLKELLDTNGGCVVIEL